MAELELDGMRLYYEVAGTGRPVLLIHGLGSCTLDWEPQVSALSRQFQVIAADLRGHGRSDQPWQGNDMDSYADDLAELVMKLDLKDAIHVGHSTGGAIVIGLSGWNRRSPRL